MALQSNFAKLHAKDLRNFLSVGPNGPNLIVNKLKSYKNIDDGSVSSYMEKNPDSINLEWYHHMKCWQRFCDEGKIRRQQRKEEKGERTSSKGPTSTEVSPVEVEPMKPRRKMRVNQSQKLNEIKTLPQRNAHVLPEICTICLFVGETLLGFHWTR